MGSTIDFSGKVALVTGGARGIGAAGAKAFAESGASVVIADLLPEVEQTVADIQAGGGKALGIVCDVSDPAQCKNMVAQTVNTFGKLDFAFNNAGIGGARHLLHEMPDDAWDQVIRINLSGVFHSIKHEIPAMLNNSGGVIVNTSSICGVRPVSDHAHYVAAKHGVVGLTRQVALEYGAKGIRSVAIGPGFIDTEMTQETMSADPTILSGLKASIPMGRVGEPEDVGRVARMLCTEDAAYINGAYLEVDGGMLLV